MFLHKIQIDIKSTNCTPHAPTFSISIDCKDGKFTHKSNTTTATTTNDFILKSRYHKLNKTRTLVLYYKPYELVFLLTKFRTSKNLSISVAYPSSSSDTKQICDDADTSSAYAYNAASLFEKLNSGVDCSPFSSSSFNLFSIPDSDNENSKKLKNNLDVLNRRRCQLENFVNLAETNQRLGVVLKPTVASTFREINLSHFEPLSNNFFQQQISSNRRGEEEETRPESATNASNSISSEYDYDGDVIYDQNQANSARIGSESCLFWSVLFVFVFLDIEVVGFVSC